MEQSTSARDHYERGCELKRNHMFDEALDEFQQAAADPQYAGKAHLQMALCLRSTERGEAAVVAFRRALELSTFSSKENAHILYFLGQTLESLGQDAEALEAYGWARYEDPGLQQVEHRIKHLLSGRRSPLPQRQPGNQSLIGDMLRLSRQLTPQILSLLEQGWKSLGQYADELGTNRWGRRQTPSFRDLGHQRGHRELTLTRCSPSASRDRRQDTRRHVRVAVRLRNHFSSKGQKVAGEGELRDLSPGGCRITSSVAVPVGVELECCIFPQGEVNPFTIEGATVRWSSPLEFGVAFTKVRPGVQRKITQLCSQRIALA